ncbi:MAG: efflux RND transporter permease subunit [Gammaproteobacteria bacterium]|uniref:Efflux RND transporter permease subunit n=1 Tax=Shewanella vaxholmensis TaxID=3063535 RepID=A0ABU9UQB2_9GAMM|nr:MULTISPECIES: efflux RND transporter permease subunit [unclassified Shewanella]EGT3625910.1 efflux RND transporter permease subunit [Morganella morganii]MBU1394253.1 efflux RND transporter permease subunit [Gammaproteobacteria bacterium]MBU1478451.1 efflux RND transporter permease subunit [Gammaproteobacteria bacterium]MBU2001432.1 efflux RND transporter permease subunit [Gammaproteobacteria bacterium]MBU2134472.1 efflux RND transporter permease subunit [Gammaproteobacteria bacterium]
MILTDLSVKRPVFASVISLLLVAFGLVSFDKLPLREYPNIDPPVVSIDTNYRGASAAVVESRITQLIEDRISGVEGIRHVSSSSSDGRSSVTLEFDISRNIEDAANDVRDRISGLLDNLPEEADPPEVQKANGGDEVIMWLNLVSDQMTTLELTDYTNRYLADRFSVVDGVARMRIGGGKVYAMRIWLDRQALASRSLTVADVESALRAENVELPAGSIESKERHFTVRLERGYRTAEDFANLVITQGEDGYLVKLGDVARVEIGSEEERIMFRGNKEAMIGLGVSKQSTANTLEVARAVNALVDKINPTLPAGMSIKRSYDSSVFIEASIKEVYQTLFTAMVLVIIVIYLFLGSVRAMLIPAITVPVSLLGTFIVLYALGYTINLLTLLAMILAIGMVVDDAIVMLENIHRRIEEGDSPLKAAFLGAREVAFAVIATTLVLVAVFMPITFLEGDLGKLFKEFAVTMSAAVLFSSLVALTLTPMMCSKLLKPSSQDSWLVRKVDGIMTKVSNRYQLSLKSAMAHPLLMSILVLIALGSSAYLAQKVPQEFAPQEDRGSLFLMVNGPQGASYEYIESYMNEVENRLMPLVDTGDIKRLLIRAPRGFGRAADFSNGMAIVVLEDWGKRRPVKEVIADINKRLADLAGVQAFPVMRQAFGRGVGKPVQFVIGGPSYEELARWRDIMMQKAAQNPKLLGLDHDYKETKPQLRVVIDRDRAASLGVSISNIGRTLESMLGSRLVTTFMRDGEEYDVIIEGERGNQNTAADLQNIYVRSERTQELIPLSNLVTVEEFADASSLNRYNRMRAITIEASLEDGYSLGEALDYMNQLARAYLPAEAVISYKGQSLDYQESGSSMYFVFLLALGIVFLVLAAQFESYIHPMVIMLTVPLATVGALIGLWLTGQSLNIYSQIGIIMLVGLAAKNGILIVEFANQLRDKGVDFDKAIIQASAQRLRPILMTGITTAAGAVPLVMAAGAGAETRFVIGVVVLSGILLATLFTIFVIPAAYGLFARNSGSPEAIAQQLEKELAQD